MEHGDHRIVVDGRSLSLGETVEVSRRGALVDLDGAAMVAVDAAREAVVAIARAGVPTYGVNTGLGALSDRAIAAPDLQTLQHHLLHSHASGSGPLLPEDVARATMLIRANSLARGLSGVRVVVIQQIVDLLNTGISPAIPSKGSLGASGDLAPLAHLGLLLTGEGRTLDSETNNASTALAAAGLEPLVLEAKEALAITNGTAVMAGIATLALHDASRLVATAVAIAALSAFALGSRREPYDARLQAARGHSGQGIVAGVMRDLLHPQSNAHRTSSRVQDPYTLRCIPPVTGAVLDALDPLERALQIEINSATDNPLIFAETGEAISGSNFHGHPLALPIEYAKIAIASLGTFTERRIALLMDAEEYGLSAFLAASPGLNSGYMIAHYLSAGLASENKILAHPSAVDSISTSANIEDFNSMGTTAARHFAEIVGNVETIIAIEALCAAQACDLRGIEPVGQLGRAYALIRASVPPLESDDRIIADEVETMGEVVRSGQLGQLVDWKGGAS